MKKTALIFILITWLFYPQAIFARTTPGDIINSQKETFNQRSSSYSTTNKQKLQTFEQKIADFNKKITDDLEFNLLKQGQILEEYSRRQNLELSMGSQDGISRNLQDPIENAQYYLNYAHEAVAYQAAKVYIFNLTSENNINTDIILQINNLQADIGGLKAKVEKSRATISSLIK